jgi:PKHD-type hydroxylase
MQPLCIADLLDPAEAAALRRRLHSLPRTDGRKTAGWAARGVKANEQFDGDDPGVQALQHELHARLLAHPLLRLYARPQRMTLPLLNAYAEGMRYGRHVDDALMGEPPLRTDVAFTLFLAEPAAYDGGELVLEGLAGELPIKLPAGAAVVYPAGALHRVETVTRGERLAAVGWVQSQVRDAARREVLFDLDRARRALFERDGDSEEFQALSRSSGALLRMWAEP